MSEKEITDLEITKLYLDSMNLHYDTIVSFGHTDLVYRTRHYSLDGDGMNSNVVTGVKYRFNTATGKLTRLYSSNKT